MDSSLKFDYYYGAEAEQFSFYRVPRLLVSIKILQKREEKFPTLE